MMGVRPEEAVKELAPLGVLAVGVNCGNNLDDNLVALTAMRTVAPETTLIAKPNAGLPRVEGIGTATYDMTPEVMAEYALKFAAQHVKMFGGCCGSTPRHIAAAKKALQAFEPPALERVMAENLATSTNGSDDPQQRRRSARRRERAE
jgi:5-methyltetrahydrofolate--homocysteine methyltransferase